MERWVRVDFVRKKGEKKEGKGTEGQQWHHIDVALCNGSADRGREGVGVAASLGFFANIQLPASSRPLLSRGGDFSTKTLFSSQESVF